jgi:predicted ribosomally synthesized peptide with nif11-like leader
MANKSLEDFFQKILQTPELQQELIQSNSLEEFVRIAIKVAKNCGYEFTAKELEEDLKANLYVSDHEATEIEGEPNELSQVHTILMEMQWAKGNIRKSKAWDAIKQALHKPE